METHELKVSENLNANPLFLENYKFAVEFVFGRKPPCETSFYVPQESNFRQIARRMLDHRLVALPHLNGHKGSVFIAIPSSDDSRRTVRLNISVRYIQKASEPYSHASDPLPEYLAVRTLVNDVMSEMFEAKLAAPNIHTLDILSMPRNGIGREIRSKAEDMALDIYDNLRYDDILSFSSLRCWNRNTKIWDALTTE